MDENTIRDEVTQELRRMFSKPDRYTDAERLAAFEILLTDILEELKPHMDVRDGSDGRQLPNWAMSLVQRIEEEMDK